MPGELEPVLPPPDLEGVPARMSQIFAEAGVADAAMGQHHAARVSALRPGRGGALSMTLLVAALAGLAGLGAGAFIIHAPPQPPPAPVLQPVAQASPQTTPQAAPQTASVADSEPPLILAPPAREAAAAPAIRAPRPRAALARAVRREPMPMAQPASCERNAAGSGCRDAVIQADRHLRNVYASAIRRGVPRAVLIDYRDRWADLRESGSDDPVHLIRGYGALAYDLGREARDDQEGAARRRNPSGLRALASALAPWW
jgi:hypothetical protein